MRNNQPVTGTEYRISVRQTLISRTDVKGKITYVNNDFIEVSGFTEEELIGAPHNIVRHPDMPPEAFADLWATLITGRGWTGMVKNRRKNGDHYWVLANATPIFENGSVIGYTSVRTMPDADQIAEAEAVYARFREGRAGGLAIRKGRVVRTGVLGVLTVLRHLNIRGRLNAVLAVLCLAIASLGVLGLVGMNGSNESLHSVFQNNVTPLEQLDRVVRAIDANLIAVLEAAVAGTPEATRAAKEEMSRNGAVVAAQLAAFQATTLTPEEVKLSSQLQADYARFVEQGMGPVFDALETGDAAEAGKLAQTRMKTMYAPVKRGVDGLIELQVKMAEQAAIQAEAAYAVMRTVVVAGIAIALVFALLMGAFLTRAIVRPLTQAAEVAKQIAAGNLTARITAASNDETGEILHALQVMKSSLSNIVSGVRRNAEAIATGASEIAIGNADLSARTESQASSLEQTAASMEELTSTVKNNGDNSRGAKQLVDVARATAIEGGTAMDQVVATMTAITDSSRRITDIISVIDGIAFQTNILALNAAVEAARAGNAGRGFAVVATEVRSLAQRSAEAAKEIKHLIGDSVAQVELGAGEVQHARQTMEEIVGAVRQVSDLMNEITASSEEQTRGIEQVGEAVMHLDQVTQQNAALVEEAAAASESLKQQGSALIQGMGVFRIDATHADVSQPAAGPARAAPRLHAARALPAPGFKRAA